MKRLIQPLFIALLLSLTINCKKNTPEPEPQLPAITQEGLNTFGCLIDGEVFLPGRGMSLITSLDCFFEAFWVNVSDNDNGGLGFEFNDIINCDTIHPQNYVLNHIQIAGYNTGSFGGVYTTDSIHNGTVSINHLDMQNRVISGTFYFNAFNETNNTTVSITEGRFDINY